MHMVSLSTAKRKASFFKEPGFHPLLFGKAPERPASGPSPDVAPVLSASIASHAPRPVPI